MSRATIHPRRDGARRERGDVFAALADPTRRRILMAAGSSPGMTTTTLASELGMSRQGVAKHVDILEQAELLLRNRVGREAQIDVEIRALEQVVEFVREVAGVQWDDRLDKLKSLFADDQVTR